ncbi:MAG: transcription termination factor Rho [Phycisphaerales bacterium]|nr:MAG: transcription termination factor Rho [Phycisphaerales bacterium]
MLEKVSGVLRHTKDRGYVLRSTERSFRPGPGEVLVSGTLLGQFGLVEGAAVGGQAERSKKGKLQLIDVDSIGGLALQDFHDRAAYTDLVAIDPHERFDLGASGDTSMRIVDLIAPIGKGTRQLIVSPPKAGKTVLLEKIANAIRKDSPRTRVIVLLIDERPEEVTYFQRAVEGVEVLSSTSDHSAEEHVDLAKLVLTHVQIELECGRDVVLLIDSLTRMGRAFNNRMPRRRGRGGQTMSGGLAAGALEVPRRFFGLARKVEHGGSVTIVATCLVNTGSRMDQLIFEEFKGTGNSEIVLDRPLAEARIFPAIDLPASGTRKEARLYDSEQTERIATLRRVLSNYNKRGALEALFKLLEKYPTNQEFLQSASPGI